MNSGTRIFKTASCITCNVTTMNSVRRIFKTASCITCNVTTMNSGTRICITVNCGTRNCSYLNCVTRKCCAVTCNTRSCSTVSCNTQSFPYNVFSKYFLSIKYTATYAQDGNTNAKHNVKHSLFLLINQTEMVQQKLFEPSNYQIS